MLLKFFLLNFIIVTSVSATGLQVTDGLKSYDMEYGPAHVRFKSKSMTLTLTEKPCNKDIVLKFNSQITAMMSRAPKLKRVEPKALEIVSDGQTFYALPDSSSGRYFRLLPGEIKRLKLEEKFRCR